MSQTPPNLHDAQAVLQHGQALFNAGNIAATLQLLEGYLHGGGRAAPGIQFLRGLAFMRLNRNHQAYHAMAAELAVNPANAAAQQHVRKLWLGAPPGSSRPAERTWSTALSKEAIDSIEMAAQRYTYRGVPMIKNCFDLALYPMLLHKAKPATIIEVGAFMGASAIWFADLTRSFGLQTHIYSSDPFVMPFLEDERVTYLRGDGRNLGAVFSREFLDRLQRPLMVIEDADHELPTTWAVLNFFHPLMRAGEYIVVEDGLSAQGTRDALAKFLAAHGEEYEVDASLCDYFGYNVTWRVNGFLRRK